MNKLFCWKNFLLSYNCRTTKQVKRVVHQKELQILTVCFMVLCSKSRFFSSQWLWFGSGQSVLAFVTFSSVNISKGRDIFRTSLLSLLLFFFFLSLFFRPRRETLKPVVAFKTFYSSIFYIIYIKRNKNKDFVLGNPNISA